MGLDVQRVGIATVVNSRLICDPESLEANRAGRISDTQWSRDTRPFVIVSAALAAPLVVIDVIVAVAARSNAAALVTCFVVLVLLAILMGRWAMRIPWDRVASVIEGEITQCLKREYGGTTAGGGRAAMAVELKVTVNDRVFCLPSRIEGIDTVDQYWAEQVRRVLWNDLKGRHIRLYLTAADEVANFDLDPVAASSA